MYVEIEEKGLALSLQANVQNSFSINFLNPFLPKAVEKRKNPPLLSHITWRRIER
jgi:hypothetical protein